jgi:TonB family protein
VGTPQPLPPWVLPHILKRVEPEYDATAKEARIEGEVWLSVIVDEAGIPTQIRDLRSVHPGLTVKAIKAVEQWRFEPAVEDGVKVKVPVTVAVSFHLKTQPNEDPSKSVPGIAAVVSTEIAPMPKVAPMPVFTRSDRVGVQLPTVLFKKDPNYDPGARAAGVEGEVWVSALVDENGIPTNIEVVRSLHHGLDTEAKKAVSDWRFKPATKDGKPIPLTVTISIAFHLKSDAAH